MMCRVEVPDPASQLEDSIATWQHLSSLLFRIEIVESGHRETTKLN